jgi:hypothetical protein
MMIFQKETKYNVVIKIVEPDYNRLPESAIGLYHLQLYDRAFFMAVSSFEKVIARKITRAI